MIVRLKTLDEIKTEYKWDFVDDDSFLLNKGIYVWMYNFKLFINEKMYDYFGSEIEVDEVDEVDDNVFGYTHKQKITDWKYHKDWFCSDFINEDEMRL